MECSDLIGSDEAVCAALREAGLDRAAFSALSLCADGQRSLYELDFFSEEMEYCCFVDAETGEVAGFDSRPRAALARPGRWATGS